jgi:type VI secretion system secreted protein VgrG
MPVPITLKSALPAKDLMFESMTMSSGLSMLGEMELGLVSEKPDLKAEDLLGKPVTVTLQLREGAKRHFHGYVTRFGIGLHRGRYFGYQASVRPWLWFLTRTADCRIFQDLSVPDIVKKVFEDHGNANFEFKLFRSYRKWVYCVQYRESDYNFIARLLEHEGIYWYLHHADGQSKVVMVDSQSAHDPAKGYETLPYYEEGGNVSPDLEYVSSWSFASEVEADKVELTSYDFERPSTMLKANSKKPYEYKFETLEMFDYQGEYVQLGDGTQLAEDRLDERRTQHQLAHGASNAHGIEVGSLLTLTRHPRKDQNAKYLITGLSVHAQVNAYESGGAAGGIQCSFTAIPSAQQFRPPRVTPKPFVQGPQTAVVVGPSGEEIFTDKYGRVKVQFHWDRLGKKDEKSSCWIRVSQPWAGKGWGAVSIPRIGQEVVVDFLEGDPDQPIVTGRVYNAEQTPPFPLPAGAVVSGIKSKSHKAGGYNEMSMDDTPGKEKFTIHGQYDMASTVEHDQTTTVHNNRTDKVDVDDAETIGNNQTQTVGVNQTIKVGADRKKNVGGSETVGIAVNRSETVGGTETIVITGHRGETVNGGETVTVTGTRSHTVKGLQTTTVTLAEVHSVGAGRMHNVGAAEAITVAGGQMVSVGAAQMVSVGGLQKINVGALQSVTVGGPHKLSAAIISQTSKGIFKVKAAGTALFEAPTIILKAGGSKIIMNSSGITIKGAKVNVKADGTVSINGSGGIKLKGPSIGEN